MTYFVMNTLSQRIAVAFSQAKQRGSGITKTGLAAAAGVSKQAVSQWFTGATKSLDSDALLGAARYLQVRPEWLNGDGGAMKHELSHDLNISELHKKVRKVPLISWVQAGSWNNEQHEVLGSNEYQMLLSIFDTGENGYALRVEGESMSPRYQPGDIIYVNPDKPAENGMRVIAACSSGNTFKELVIEDGVSRLKALNPHWHPQYVPVEPDCYIVGVVVGSVKPENYE